MTTAKKDRRPPKRSMCQAVNCTAAAHREDLCKRHYAQSQATPCSVAECVNPTYAIGLCEAHYRRKKRGSKKWDRPLNRSGEELVLLNTRVPPAVAEAIVKSCEEGEAVYSKLARILEEWARSRLTNDGGPHAHAS